MKSFNDEDLKRLKFRELNFARMKDFALDVPGYISGDDILYLIHRLECAEAYAEFRRRFSAGHDGESQVLDKWLASKGEGL